MEFGIISIIFIISIVFTTIFLYKYRNKNLYLSIVSGLIIGQISLIIASMTGIIIQGDNSSISSQLIFWSINMLIPFIVYTTLLYIIYTTDIFIVPIRISNKRKR